MSCTPPRDPQHQAKVAGPLASLVMGGFLISRSNLGRLLKGTHTESPVFHSGFSNRRLLPVSGLQMGRPHLCHSRHCTICLFREKRENRNAASKCKTSHLGGLHKRYCVDFWNLEENDATDRIGDPIGHATCTRTLRV